jgi:lipoprotein-anchoring transpeptidase ErfK/SrfK
VKRAESLRPESLLVQRARTGLELKIDGEAGGSHRASWRTAILVSGLALLFALIAAWFGPMAWERVSALKNDNGGDAAAIAPLSPLREANTLAVASPVATSALQPTPTARPTVAADSSVDGTDDLGDADEIVSPEVENSEAAAVLIEPTVEYVPPDPSGLRPSGVRPDERWIDVDLNTQMLVAYEGNSQVYSTLISSGTWEYPTITGQYRTYVKYETQDMNGYLIGYDYYLQNVPHVMYFSGNFAIHGAYWHNSFGVPTSHGCVNVNPVDAGWLFTWAPVGTTVNIH